MSAPTCTRTFPINDCGDRETCDRPAVAVCVTCHDDDELLCEDHRAEDHADCAMPLREVLEAAVRRMLSYVPTNMSFEEAVKRATAYALGEKP
jgi:hypothetical protein